MVFLGNSLTAGFGLAEEQAFPALLAAELAASGRPIRAVNAGVSGDTSAGGLRRLGWLLRQKPAVLVVELGTNDALRGQPLSGIEQNLRAIITQAQQAGVRVVLLGMRIPTNYGATYAEQFHALYLTLARELDLPLVPFLLEGVALDPKLNLGDGIHPNVEGHKIVARHVLPVLLTVLPK